MSFTFYNYFALIKPGSQADIKQLAEKIKAFYANNKRQITVLQNKDNILVTIDSYNFKIVLVDNEDVLAESKEMSNHYNQDYASIPIDKTNFENCKRRFEISGEEDFDMDYFNDSLYILECIEQFDGVTILSVN
jgi:hypothetical protein